MGNEKASELCPLYIQKNSLGLPGARVFNFPSVVSHRRGVKNLDGVYVFDDFHWLAASGDGEAGSPWALHNGADAQALDPVVVAAAEEGKIVLTTGNVGDTFANDNSQIVCKVPMQADSGNLVFETRLHINTAVTNISLYAGFTDIITADEEPMSHATTSLTTNCTDGVGFLYDTASTVDNWICAAVDGNTDDFGHSDPSTVPVADVYQTLRFEVPTSGTGIKFWIDGVLVKTLTGAGVSPDVSLYATIAACATTTTSKTVDVDYIYCGCDYSRTWYHY